LQLLNIRGTLYSMNVREVGSFIRSQRTNAKMSLRKLSAAVGVSIPYLSQVERGLRRPSAEILQAIAKGLRISAETLYVKAGFLEDRAVPDLATVIMGDPSITERQKQALLQIYEAFRQESGGERAGSAPGASTEGPASAAGKAPRPSTGASKTTKPKPGRRAKRAASSSPRPAPLRAPATRARKEV
jgi:transcriptional regulator with XRE-family HTH domain